MKQAVKTMDFWEYVARIQDGVGKEVLGQVTDDEYTPCLKTFIDYMHNLRNMHLDRIWAINRHANKFIDLINEALKKRGILICEYYVHISVIKHQNYGKED